MRDKDYRGVKVDLEGRPVPDWRKLVYMARTRKPGALEVLQDTIEMWFPKQFKTAQNKAKKLFKESKTTVSGYKATDAFVTFWANDAYRRFKPKINLNEFTVKQRRKMRYGKKPLPKSRSPFSSVLGNYKFGLKESNKPSPITFDVVVWSVRRGKDLGYIR